jgi:hypothetical protein
MPSRNALEAEEAGNGCETDVTFSYHFHNFCVVDGISMKQNSSPVNEEKQTNILTDAG